jgi:ferrous iron transport protein A
MTLKDGQIGQNYIVKELKLEQQIRRRLEALGLIDGTNIQLINQNSDGAVVFKVRGTRLAIGNKIAEAICISEVAK